MDLITIILLFCGPFITPQGEECFVQFNSCMERQEERVPMERAERRFMTCVSEFERKHD